MPTANSPNSLSIRKAAVLVAALDATTADALLDALSPEQAALVRNVVISLDDVDTEEREQVLAEFLGRPSADSGRQTVDQGGVELDASLAARLAESNAPINDPPPRRDPTDTVNHRTPEASTPRFGFLRQADCGSLARLLADEAPQTVAVVLSYLPREQAAELLAKFPAATQTVVVRRLADLDEMDPESLQEVERGLESLIAPHIRRRQRRREGMEAIAGILAAAAPASQQAILAALGSDPTPESGYVADRPAAARSASVLRFSDLTMLSSSDLLTLIRAVEPELITLAMAGAEATFTARILNLLPARVAVSLQHELNHLGPTRLSDLEDAADELLRAAERLQSQGAIRFPGARISMAA